MKLDDIWTVSPSRVLPERRDLRIDFDNGSQVAMSFTKNEPLQMVKEKLLEIVHVLEQLGTIEETIKP